METVNDKKKCSRCNRGYLDHRTPRAFLVKATLFWLPIRRYKCNYCGHKRYVYGNTINEHKGDLKTT